MNLQSEMVKCTIGAEEEGEHGYEELIDCCSHVSCVIEYLIRHVSNRKKERKITKYRVETTCPPYDGWNYEEGNRFKTVISFTCELFGEFRCEAEGGTSLQSVNRASQIAVEYVLDQFKIELVTQRAFFKRVKSATKK